MRRSELEGCGAGWATAGCGLPAGCGVRAWRSAVRPRKRVCDCTLLCSCVVDRLATSHHPHTIWKEKLSDLIYREREKRRRRKKPLFASSTDRLTDRLTEPQHQPDRHRLTDPFLIVLFGVREFIKRHKAYVPGKWYNNDTTRIRGCGDTEFSGWANAERRAFFSGAGRFRKTRHVDPSCALAGQRRLPLRRRGRHTRRAYLRALHYTPYML